MATMTRSAHINTPKMKITHPIRLSMLAMCAAAIAGTVAGFLAAVAVALPAIHQELASQTKVLSSRLAAGFEEMPLTSVCAQPGPAGGVGQGTLMQNYPPTPVPLISQQVPPVVIPSEASAPTFVTNNKTFITKLVGGQMAHTTAAIKQTGPSSVNVIKTENTATTTVTNTNNVHITSDNKQQSASGDAAVVGNTIGGGAASGDAKNVNQTIVSLGIRN